MPTASRPPSCPGGNHARAPSVSPTPNDTLRGHSHSKGAYIPGMFKGVQSCDDLAFVLGVPAAAIPLIAPHDRPCRTKGCPFNAITADIALHIGGRGTCHTTINLKSHRIMHTELGIELCVELIRLRRTLSRRYSSPRDPTLSSGSWSRTSSWMPGCLTKMRKNIQQSTAGVRE